MLRAVSTPTHWHKWLQFRSENRIQILQADIESSPTMCFIRIISFFLPIGRISTIYRQKNVTTKKGKLASILSDVGYNKSDFVQYIDFILAKLGHYFCTLFSFGDKENRFLVTVHKILRLNWRQCTEFSIAYVSIQKWLILHDFSGWSVFNRTTNEYFHCKRWATFRWGDDSISTVARFHQFSRFSSEFSLLWMSSVTMITE